MTRLAETAGLRLARIIYDSSEFQFLGSEQYLRDIPLMAKGSCRFSDGETIFSAEEVQRYRRLAEELNASERGDQAAFYLKRS